MKLLLLFLLTLNAFAGLKLSKDQQQIISLTNRAYGYTSSGFNVGDANSLAIAVNNTLATPSATTFLPADIDLTGNTITKTSHGLPTGLKGQVATSSTFPSPLAATNYYVISVDANNIKLASSYANAGTGTQIDLTTAGAGLFTLNPQDFVNATFDGASDLDDTAETITVAAHGFITGMALTVTTAGTLPLPLVVLTTYYAIVVDANTVKLATSLANAQAGTAIDLTDGIGNTTLVPATYSNKTFTEASVTIGSDQIAITTHAMFKGLQVALTKTSALPAGLLAVTDYFIIKISDSVYKFAATLVDAQSSTAIDITDVGSGTTTFTPTPLAGATIKIQAALADTDALYQDLTDANIGDASQSISATGSLFFTKINPEFPWYRLVLALTAGSLTVDAKYTLKSDAVR